MIQVDAYGPDRYKRIPAVIWDVESNLNLVMVAKGYAEGHRGEQCRVYCREMDQAEAKARRERVVIWAQGRQYKNPAAFRREMRIMGE